MVLVIRIFQPFCQVRLFLSPSTITGKKACADLLAELYFKFSLMIETCDV